MVQTTGNFTLMVQTTGNFLNLSRIFLVWVSVHVCSVYVIVQQLTACLQYMNYKDIWGNIPIVKDFNVSDEKLSLNHY